MLTFILDMSMHTPPWGAKVCPSMEVAPPYGTIGTYFSIFMQEISSHEYNEWANKVPKLWIEMDLVFVTSKNNSRNILLCSAKTQGY